MAGSTSTRTELIKVLGDVKALLQDRLGLNIPMPQFILIGKQSVGKSRLTEALAGEAFNFCSGTLGSRRPTVLEFKNDPTCVISRWYVRDRTTGTWQEQPVHMVMKIVGDAHEELGETTSTEPVYVRLESASTVDMAIVDLPGFREFAMDAAKQNLSDKIQKMVQGFMKDKRNVMLCVEQANDAATMATLALCRQIDPKFERTILIRNKLDKYYNDLTNSNANEWVDGFGDLPSNLTRFALTLPWWYDGEAPPSISELRSQKDSEDITVMQSRGLSQKYLSMIGFRNFQSYMEIRTEQMFAASLGPTIASLNGIRISTAKREQQLLAEFKDTEPTRILTTTRECGTSCAHALTHVMEGVLTLTRGCMTLENELREFHEFHEAKGSKHFNLLPDDFTDLEDYIHYLREDVQVGACDVEINGGAQFRRLMSEVEIFMRFSDIACEVKKRDVLQARGAMQGSSSWRNVIVKLLSNDGHVSLQRGVQYAGERMKWFFQQQKEAVLEWMESLEGTPKARMYSSAYSKHVRLIKQNDMIKHLVFQTFDNACNRQLEKFSELFDNMLSSTFSNPWVLFKAGSMEPLPANAAKGDGGSDSPVSAESAKTPVPADTQGRSNVESALSKWLEEIPADPSRIDEAVEKVQMLVAETYAFIRSQVCDQVELFAESFFKLPMVRSLAEDMSMIELSELDKSNYQARRERLTADAKAAQESLLAVDSCIERLQSFKRKCEARGGA